jgi:hypothetical protein
MRDNTNKLKIINILPEGGLCNRLRHLFSWIHKTQAESNNYIINVLWTIDKDCIGTYDSCFESIKNVNIIYDNFKNYSIDHMGCTYVNSQYSPKYINNFYSKLKINSKLRNLINNFKDQNIFSEYNAVHIRRTDHSKLAKRKNQYTKDDVFEKFIEGSLLPVYLSTDNKKTQNKYKKKYSNVIVYKNINRRYRRIIPTRRQTTLSHAVIDLWMCIESQSFIPSGFSSFSGLIQEKRKELYG